MKKWVLGAFGAIAISVAGTSATGAAGVCNCCSGETEDLCKPACEAANTSGGICRPVAFFGDARGIGGDMPLNGFSYKELSLDGASRQELEALRRWLERERRKTERRARRSTRDYRRRRISLDEFTVSRKIREEAIINYQHGIQKYLAAGN
jgi:hypothetical protein